MINWARVTGFDWNEGNSRKEANKRDIPYQSLIKAWLAEDVSESRRAG